MKHIIKITGVFIALITVVSCEEFLEEIPKSQASPENYYQTEDQAEAAVVGAYSALQRTGVYGFKMQFFINDVERTNKGATEGGLGALSMSASTTFLGDIWEDHYRGINEMNAAIENLPKFDMDQERKNTLIAETKFLRALLHFNLVRIWGNVPYRDTETTSLNDLLVSNTPVEESYTKMITDLEFCLQQLDSKDVAVAGRVTTGAAQTLLAKIYLTRASTAKRDGTGDGLADFQKAAQYAQEVIGPGVYSLNDYYPDAFIIENKNNDEIIFDVQHKSGGLGEGTSIGRHMGLMGSWQQGGSWGSIHATEYYHTIFESTDFVRTNWNAPHERVNGDGTLKFYSEMDGQRWKIGKFRRYPMRHAENEPADWSIHWPVFRYAEVLLIKAEALNEFGGGQTEIFDALNQLRKRARNVNVEGAPNTGISVHDDVLPRVLTIDNTILPDISATEYPDYNARAQYIMDERARELGGETKRWFDLIRWGNYVERMQFLGTHVPDGRTRSEKDWSAIAGNADEKHFLMPIPQNDLLANPNLKQNPGY